MSMCWQMTHKNVYQTFKKNKLVITFLKDKKATFINLGFHKSRNYDIIWFELQNTSALIHCGNRVWRTYQIKSKLLVLTFEMPSVWFQLMSWKFSHRNPLFWSDLSVGLWLMAVLLISAPAPQFFLNRGDKTHRSSSRLWGNADL